MVTFISASVVLAGSCALLVLALKQAPGNLQGVPVVPFLPAIWMALSVIVICAVLVGLPGLAVVASSPCLLLGLDLIGANNVFRVVGVAIFVMFFAAITNWIALHEAKLESWRKEI